jgi:hypothetical protein
VLLRLYWSTTYDCSTRDRVHQGKRLIYYALLLELGSVDDEPFENIIADLLVLNQMQFYSAKPYWRMKPTEIVSSDSVTTYGVVTTKGFLTAGKDQNTFQIAFSFFATVMGAQSVTFPAFYSSYAGWLGLLFYALSTGAPIVLVGLIGPAVRCRWPQACSLGDFVHYRYCTSTPRSPAFEVVLKRFPTQLAGLGPRQGSLSPALSSSTWPWCCCQNTCSSARSFVTSWEAVPTP